MMMDHLSLHLIFLEIRNGILGSDLLSLRQPEEETFLFYFSGDSLKKLLIAVKPGHPRIHLAKQAHYRGGERIISGFQSLLRQSIEGLCLKKVEKDREERLIKFQFGEKSNNNRVDFTLMLEMLGRSSNLILTNAKEKVLGYCRKLKSEFRQPILGYPYQPPIRPETSIFDLLKDPRLDQYMMKDSHEAFKLLMDSLKGIPEEIVGEIIDRARKQGSFSNMLNQIIGNYEKRKAPAYIYSSLPLQDIGENLELTRKNFILSPIRLHSRRNMVESSYLTLNEAAESYYLLLIRNEAFLRRKNLIGKMIRKEKLRWNSTLLNLERDRKKYENPEQFKKYGEMILAGLKTATIKDKFVECDDCYSNKERVRIPIDPSLSLPQNAERYFRKFRKAERGLQKIEERKQSSLWKIARLEDLENELQNVIDSSSLETLEEKLRNEGLAVGIKIRGKGALSSGTQISGIRIYKSSDGLQILVGKTAKDNMKLSFKVASPEDFWMHASGYGGAHVIVRNPTNLKRIPEKTLLEAAKLAAFYSSGKREGKVEVHYSKKKYVRKGKTLPIGTVLIKKFESILIAPENLFSDE